MAMSLAEILNPQAWRHYREQQMRVEIEGYKYQQRDRHHYDQMRVADEKNQIAKAKAESENQIARDRLEFDIRNSIAQHETAKNVAEIQAINNLEIKRLEVLGDMMIESHKATSDLIKKSYELDIDYASSTIRQADALSNALANILEQTILKELDFEHKTALAEQQERFREKERHHEIISAVLKAKLERYGFTHAEITRLIVRLAEPITATESDDDLMNKFSGWYEYAKRDLQ